MPRALLVILFLGPYTLMASLAGLLLAHLTRSAAPLYRLGRFGVRVSLWLAGTKVVLEGREHLADLRNAVVMANHVSHLDAPILFQALGVDFKAILKKELMRAPVFNRVLRFAGFVEVDRRDRTQATAVIARTTRSLQDGNTFLVFPEGTRSRTGALGEFKRGGFAAGIEAGSRIVPVAVHGTRELMPRGGFRIRPGVVRVRVLDPVESGRYSYDDREQLAQEVRGRIAAALADLERRAEDGVSPAA
jgi:1-acyl-sn-glycerol-3-phosphate acyltransferase